MCPAWTQLTHFSRHWRTKIAAAKLSNLTRCQRLRGVQALHVLGFQTFVAGYDFKGDFFAFIEGFESGADDGRVMHKDVLARTLGDKAEPFLVIEPLYFATSHIQLLTFF
jgi:hypothetical protein